jgi:rRNA-processing protein FCF1
MTGFSLQRPSSGRLYIAHGSAVGCLREARFFLPYFERVCRKIQWRLFCESFELKILYRSEKLLIGANMNTMANRIRDGLQDITNQLMKLIGAIPIERQDNPVAAVGEAGIVKTIGNTPTYYWGERTPKQTNIQIELKKKYDTISEIINVIFIKAPKNILNKLKQADSRYRMWLQLEHNPSFYSSLSTDHTENEKQLRKCAEELEHLLNILEAGGNSELILIPDTNSLLISTDPIKYRNIVDETNFVFLLLPTVLGELDKLKNNYNVEVCNKSKGVIKRIKGWRTQGHPLSGVTVDKTITVRTISNEPNMKQTLSWLDKDNADDRIIASVLEIQADYSTSRVVLVTGDINLQNKAEFAMIEFKEI